MSANSMKKVLITGAAGFIGSHLTEACMKEGLEVRAFIRYNSASSQGWLDHIGHKNGLKVIAGDVRDFDSVHHAMKGCDTVFHLAALIGIPYSYRSPLAYIKTNVEGTQNVLQAARELDLKNVIITSTSETFGTAQYVPIDEKHPMSAQSPYAATKVAADQLALSFYRSFGLPVKVARPFNTYGPRQSTRAVIPTIITQILGGKTEIELGALHPTRDFTFVKDTVNGFLKIALSKELFGEVTNIGMNEEVSIRELVDMIAGLLKKKIRIKQGKQRVRPKESEVGRLRCDATKLTKATGWFPRYDLKKGLKETIEWFKEHDGEYKTGNYSI